MKLSDTIEHMLRTGARGRDIVDFVRDYEAKHIIKEKQARTRDLGGIAEFRAVFAGVDETRISAFIKHRKAKKAALTGYAAQLFATDAAECGLSLSEAIDTCISRNWITVKAEWLRPRNSPASSRRESYADAYQEIIGNERTAFAANNAPVEQLSSDAGYGQEDGIGSLLHGHAGLPAYRH